MFLKRLLIILFGCSSLFSMGISKYYMVDNPAHANEIQKWSTIFKQVVRAKAYDANCISKYKKTRYETLHINGMNFAENKLVKYESDQETVLFEKESWCKDEKITQFALSGNAKYGIIEISHRDAVSRLILHDLVINKIVYEHGEDLDSELDAYQLQSVACDDKGMRFAWLIDAKQLFYSDEGLRMPTGEKENKIRMVTLKADGCHKILKIDYYRPVENSDILFDEEKNQLAIRDKEGNCLVYTLPPDELPKRQQEGNCLLK